MPDHQTPVIAFGALTLDLLIVQMHRSQVRFLVGGVQILLERLRQFVKEIQAGGSAADGSSQATVKKPQENVKTIQVEAVGSEKQKAKIEEQRSSGRIGKKRKFATTEKFYARRQDIFECFVNPQKIAAYTRSPAQVHQYTWHASVSLCLR